MIRATAALVTAGSGTSASIRLCPPFVEPPAPNVRLSASGTSDIYLQHSCLWASAASNFPPALRGFKKDLGVAFTLTRPPSPSPGAPRINFRRVAAAGAEDRRPATHPKEKGVMPPGSPPGGRMSLASADGASVGSRHLKSSGEIQGAEGLGGVGQLAANSMGHDVTIIRPGALLHPRTFGASWGPALKPFVAALGGCGRSGTTGARSTTLSVATPVRQVLWAGRTAPILLSIESRQTVVDFYSSRWLLRIAGGQIKRNGETLSSPTTVVRAGDELEYARRPWQEPPAPCCLPVLYEDQHIVAVAKPAGLQVVRGGLFFQRTAAPVHRLGRGTSAARVQLSADFADVTTLSEAAGSSGGSGRRERRRAKRALPSGDSTQAGGPPREKAIMKTYRALASGIIAQDEMVIEQPIGRVKYRGVAEGLFMACATGKASLTRVRVIHRHLSANTTLVEVDLYTGRAHQIRIHLAYAGHPLVGDPLYGVGGVPLVLSQEGRETGGTSTLLQPEQVAAPLETDNEALKARVAPAESDSEPLKTQADGGHERPLAALPGDCGYLLHSCRLTFRHPVSLKVLEVTAMPPNELLAPNETGEFFMPPY
eukprot:jgi/Mesen1/6123/ME000312S05266